MGRFRPDVIVINLGTNDLSWCAGRPERCAEYRKGYADFLKTVRKDNPEAEILCILGVMGEGLNDSMEAAVRDYKAETGDEKIRSLTLREQDGKRNGYGANYHPSEQTQPEARETGSSFISSQMMRGSRRNQVIWRLAKRLMALPSSSTICS